MSSKNVTASITAQNTFTDAVSLIGLYNLSISGTWVATVTLQRSFDAGSNWLDVDTKTGNTETWGREPEPGVVYRVGIKTGDFTSGTCVVRLSQ